VPRTTRALTSSTRSSNPSTDEWSINRLQTPATPGIKLPSTGERGLATVATAGHSRRQLLLRPRPCRC
jgi:hypothetical protein